MNQTEDALQTEGSETAEEFKGYTLSTIIDVYITFIDADADTRYGHRGANLKGIIMDMIDRKCIKDDWGSRKLGRLVKAVPGYTRSSQIIYMGNDIDTIIDFLAEFPRNDNTLLSLYIHGKNKQRASNNLSPISKFTREEFQSKLDQISPIKFSKKYILTPYKASNEA